MRKKIVAFGEVVWDILPVGKVLGGTPSNIAFRCNLFGDEGHLLSRIGDDDPGHHILQRLQEIGISTGNIQMDSEFPTGTVIISFNEKNEPIYNVAPDVAFDHIEFSTEALKLAREADCLFYGLLPQRFGISKNTIRELIREAHSSLKFFDLKLFQHFFHTPVVENLLHSSNIVRIKEKEIGFLGQKLGFSNEALEPFSRKLVKKYQVDLVLITRGARGIFAFHKEQGVFKDSGYPVHLKDNIGSGMAFAAGFLNYYLHGSSIQEAINFGNAAGALNATMVGATTWFNKEAVLRFMKDNQKS